MKVLLTSLEDQASCNIKDRLMEEAVWEEVGVFNDRPIRRSGDLLLIEKEGTHLYFEDVDREISDHLNLKIGYSPEDKASDRLELIVFLSRHRSEKEIRSLTVHPPGNYLSADFGGESGMLPPSAPHEMSKALRLLYKTKKAMGIKDRTTYEVTHHGPFISTPSFFIEIGSSIDRWEVPELGRAIARSLIALFQEPHDDLPVAVGVGGGHYAPRFTDRAMRKKFDFGHMVPDYILHSTSDVKETLKKAIGSTHGAEYVFLHRSNRNKEVLNGLEVTVSDLGLELANPE